MTRPDLALAIHKTRYFHSSSFVELEGGRVLHAADTRFTYSDDGGITWSKEFHRYDAAGNIVGGGGTSLVKLDGKGIGYAGMDRRDSGRGYSRIVFWRSPDGGETWEAPTVVSTPGVSTHLYQDAATRTSSGRIVVAVYGHLGQSFGNVGKPHPGTGKLVNNQWVSTAGHFHDPHFTYVYFCYSDDEGRTWKRNKDGELMILMDTSTIFSYVNEPTVTEVYPGRLLSMMRTGLGRQFQAWSSDTGETWTRPMPTSLSASTTPAQIRALHNGHLLVVWNQESERETQMGYNRTRMSSAISRNGGSVWEFYQNVHSLHETTRVEPGPIRPTRPEEAHYEPGWPAPERPVDIIQTAESHGRWSYPSVFVMKDRVFIAHTYTMYKEHPTEATIISDGGKNSEYNQLLKVLPVEWFYGGKKPADNPFLKRAHEAAVP